MYSKCFGAESLLEFKDETTFIDYKVWFVYIFYAYSKRNHTHYNNWCHAQFSHHCNKTNSKATCLSMIQNEDDDDDDISIRERT